MSDKFISCDMGQIFMSQRAFQELQSAKLPVRGSIQVRRIAKALKKEADIFNEQIEEIQEEYAERDESGNKIISNGQLQVTDMEAYRREVDELMSTGVVMNVWPLKLSFLGDIKISAEDLELLEFMIEDDLDEHEPKV